MTRQHLLRLFIAGVFLLSFQRSLGAAAPVKAPDPGIVQVELPALPAGQGMALLKVSSKGDWRVVSDEDLTTAITPTLVADDTLGIIIAPPGKYHVRYRPAGLLKKWQALTVEIAGPVKPPAPPAPKPPTPPLPDPNVIEPSKLYVLIVEETNDRSKLTAGQREIILGTAAGSVRDYLGKHCVVESDKRPAFRIFDPNDDLSKETEVWQEAWKQPRDSLPWIIISNGKPKDSGGVGYRGPLPATADECLKLLKKYGGD